MKIYWHDGKKNIIGKNVKKDSAGKDVKLGESWTDYLVGTALKGYEFDRITILRIENGQRFVPDYEIKLLCEVLEVSYSSLLD